MENNYIRLSDMNENSKANKMTRSVQRSIKIVSGLDSHSYTCLCPATTQLPCPSPYSPSLPVENGPSKYYQEIGAEMMDNQLLIRLEKDKSKPKKKKQEWDPPCDCVEIQRPTSKKGPKIINADYDDRVVFRIHSSLQLNKQEESTYESQTIAYKIESCRDERDSHQCKTITVCPQKSIPGSQEVYTNHMTEGNQDIFLLRVKKKTGCPDQRDRNIELELRTPKPPKLSKPLTASSTQSTVTSSQPEVVADLVLEDVKQLKNSEKPKKRPKRKTKKK